MIHILFRRRFWFNGRAEQLRSGDLDIQAGNLDIAEQRNWGLRELDFGGIVNSILMILHFNLCGDYIGDIRNLTFELIESVGCIAGWLTGRACAPSMWWSWALDEPLGEGCTSRPARRGQSSGLGEQNSIGERARHAPKAKREDLSLAHTTKRVSGLYFLCN